MKAKVADSNGNGYSGKIVYFHIKKNGVILKNGNATTQGNPPLAACEFSTSDLSPDTYTVEAMIKKPTQQGYTQEEISSAQVVVCDVTIDTFWAHVYLHNPEKAIIYTDGKALIDDNTGTLNAQIHWNNYLVSPQDRSYNNLPVTAGVWSIPSYSQIYTCSPTIVGCKVNINVIYNIHGLSVTDSDNTVATWPK
ncbi:MAG: hypothetical protein GXO71_06145 [Caldiserica bacterium]|nr:hypothetical protein [Caldisericota bacterium]